jgi:glycosyltransferase involved in cell wall biosynthesis
MTDLAVVIPCFNAEAYIADAVESVLGQMDDIEIVVVDDGSIDNSVAVAASYGPSVRVVVHGCNLGLVAAIDSGLTASRAGLVMILADDDVLLPGSIPALVAAAAAHPDFGVFIPEVDAVDFDTGNPLYRVELQAPVLDLHRILSFQIPQTCGVVFRREVLVAHPYRPVADGSWVATNSEDLQQWLELAKSDVQAMVVAGARAWYRNRPGSLSGNVAEKWRAGNVLLSDARFRHPDCRECERAAARGRQMLRSYCFNKDLVRIFGSNRGRFSSALVALRRDPILAPRLAYAAGWRLRDGLLGRAR